MIDRGSHMKVVLPTIYFALFISVVSTSSVAVGIPANDEPEYAPIVERQMDFQEFQLKTPEGNDFDLRDYAADKKLLIIGFVAGWCKNSNQNGHIVKKLYDKYKTRGLGVVAV